jgi:hypothetical protein
VAQTKAACSLGLSATSQQYFSLITNQPPATSQQYFPLRTTSTSHQPPAKRTGRLRLDVDIEGELRSIPNQP